MKATKRGMKWHTFLIWYGLFFRAIREAWNGFVCMVSAFIDDGIERTLHNGLVKTMRNVRTGGAGLGLQTASAAQSNDGRRGRSSPCGECRDRPLFVRHPAIPC